MRSHLLRTILATAALLVLCTSSALPLNTNASSSSSSLTSSVGPLITPATVPSLLFREGIFSYGIEPVQIYGTMQMLASSSKQGIVYIYSPTAVYNHTGNSNTTTRWMVQKQYITEGMNKDGWKTWQPTGAGSSADICSTFVLGTGETMLYLVCGPNVIAVSTHDGEVVWITKLVSNVPLNGGGSTTPDLRGLAVLPRMVTANETKDVLVAYGYGAMWTLDQNGLTLLNQFGPMNTGLRPSTNNLLLLEATAWNLTAGTLIGGFSSDDSKFGSFELTFPTTAGAKNWLLTKTGPIHTVGADTLDSPLLVSTPSTVVIRSTISPGTFTDAIICQRATLTCIDPAKEIQYPDIFSTAPLISSNDGRYILPSIISESKIFILDTETQSSSPDGIVIPNLSGMSLLLDGENLYLTAMNYLVVLNFTALVNGTVEPLWSFNYAESKDSQGATTYPPVLQNLMGNALLTLVPDGIVNSTSYTLVIYSQEAQLLTPPDYATTTYLTVFTSVKAPQCGSLAGVNDNCGTCDGVTTGVITARSCAYCSESSLCTGYLFSSHAAPGEICSDSGFPLSLDKCNGDPADRTVAIVVGCVVGGIILLAGLICYLARRRKSALEAAVDQGQATSGTYQSI